MMPTPELVFSYEVMGDTRNPERAEGCDNLPTDDCCYARHMLTDVFRRTEGDPLLHTESFGARIYQGMPDRSYITFACLSNMRNNAISVSLGLYLRCVPPLVPEFEEFTLEHNGERRERRGYCVLSKRPRSQSPEEQPAAKHVCRDTDSIGDFVAAAVLAARERGQTSGTN